MTPKRKKKEKNSKPDYSKMETFADYKSAAGAFSDFNPQRDTVFVGSSIDPSTAQKKANNASSVSASKGASSVNYNDQKVYRTENEAGKTVYVHLKKHDKKEKYSKGGIMKAKKKGMPSYGKGGYVVEYSKGGKMEYKKGGKLGNRKSLDFNKDGKLTKEDFAMLRAMAKRKKGKK